MQTGVGIGVGTVFRAGSADTRIRQPIVLVSPTTGAVFVTAAGKVLTRGTKRVKPLPQE